MRIITYPFYLLASIILFPFVLIKPFILQPKITLSRILLILLSELDDE